MFALGGKLFSILAQNSIGERLIRACASAYDACVAGLVPEIFGIVPCKSIVGFAHGMRVCEWKGDKRLKKGLPNRTRFKRRGERTRCLWTSATTSFFLSLEPPLSELVPTVQVLQPAHSLLKLLGDRLRLLVLL